MWTFVSLIDTSQLTIFLTSLSNLRFCNY
jgi:hypothetical protein